VDDRADQGIEIERGLGGRMFAYQVSQMTDDAAGAHGLLDDFFKSAGQHPGIGLILVQQRHARLRVGHDGGQRLVEFVGHVGGQLHRQTEPRHLGQFHLLPPELIFGQFAGGDVLGQAGDAIDMIAVVANGKTAIPDPAHRAIRTNDPVFLVEKARLQFVGVGGLQPRPVVGMDGLQPVQRPLVQGVDGPTPDLFVGRTDVENAFLGQAVDPEHFPEMLGQLPEPFLAVAQGEFHLHPGGVLLFQRPIDGQQFGGAFLNPRLQLAPDLTQPIFGPLARGAVAGDIARLEGAPRRGPAG
jgi:hypothetical protein